jgi:hypothetical protein
VGLLELLAVLFTPSESPRVAEQRALELLKSHLSDTQLAEFNALGRFEVTGGDTGTRYVIRNFTSINIDQLNSEGEPVKGWCFGPQGNLARGDVLLAQKLALECFESQALERAHSHTINLPAHRSCSAFHLPGRTNR